MFYVAPGAKIAQGGKEEEKEDEKDENNEDLGDVQGGIEEVTPTPSPTTADLDGHSACGLHDLLETSTVSIMHQGGDAARFSQQ